MSYEQTPNLDMSWDVRTSCDIRLQGVFQAPYMQGIILEINTDSAVQTLEHLSGTPGSDIGPRINITAREEDFYRDHDVFKSLTPNNDFELHGSALARTDVGRLTTKSDPLRIKSIDVDIVIPSDDIHQAALELVEYSSNSIEISPTLQGTVVHELQHVADYTDAEMTKSEQQYQSRLSRKHIMTQIASIVTTVEVPTMAVYAATRSPIGGAIVGTLCAALYTRSSILAEIKNNYIHRRTTQSPFEKRAYSTEDIAQSLPTILHVSREQ